MNLYDLFESKLNEFAPGSGGDSGNYFQELARAWYNGAYDSGSLQKGIKSQQDIERLLQRGIVGPDGVTRKYGIDYNSDFDGVVISSDDYYEHSDYNEQGQEVDSRTGQKWGPYDYMEFGGEELDESAQWRDPKYRGQLYTQEKPDYNDTREYDNARFNPKPKGYPGRKELPGGGEYDRTDPLVRGAGIGRSGIKNNILDRGKRKGLPSRDQITSLKQSIRDISGRHPRANLPKSLNEFAPDSNGGGEDDALRNYAKMWWAGDEATQMQIEAALAKMGWEIGEDEGGYDNGGVFVVRAGDVNGNSYTSWAAEDLTEGLFGNKKPAEPFEFYLDGCDPHAVKKYLLNKFGSQGWRVAGPGAGTSRVFVAMSPELYPTGNQAKWDIESNCGQQGMAEATGDQKFDSMMSQMTAEPKYPDQDMPPTSITELIQWADRNNKPYHEYFAQWARRNGFKNVNDALVWFGDNVDPSNPWGPKDFIDPFGRPAAEELEDAAKHDPKAAELMKVFRCYEEIVFDWPDEYRQMNMPVSRKGTDESVAVDPNNPWGPQGRFVGDTGPAQITTTVPRHEFRAGDRVMYKPTGVRARIENLYKNGTVARIHIASGMGGQYFDAKVADLRPIGQGSLEEKSTSQAQFRTMAAAAHDPKFARKVGIKQSVAREFNKADKGQSYKSLPKKADEGKGDYVPPKEADYGDEYQAMVKRVGEKARAQEKAKQQSKDSKQPTREHNEIVSSFRKLISQ